MGKLSITAVFFVSGIFWASCTGARLRLSDAAPTKNIYTLKKKHMKPLVDFACKQLTVPYKWGGGTPKGFDCSGLTSYCYKHFGVEIPRTALAQSLCGKRIRSKRAKPGDLIFFQGPEKKDKQIGHVGIVVSGRKKAIKFIHAGSKGVAMSSLREEYFHQRFKIIRRIRK
ncbi:C40 family peptidase [Flavobacterium sp. UBA7682]|uniref:C40 family peptidase n=1 Tax=Flavobacterium sp. UBA7682 TaxID=1946560 RepID=UPI0025BCA15D|nr:C40 family peptidase [Flavobacterium sp. UBA7682]